MSVAKNRVSKKKQKVLRNVLVLSAKTHWPVTSDQDSLSINNKLRTCLPPVKINIPRVPWNVLRCLSKEERRKKQNEILNSQTPEVIKSYHKALELRKYLFFGINSLCKGIEGKKVACCILDANVSPKILVTHVAELAKNSNVPALSVHYLKETLNSLLGFSSITLGFEKSVEEDTSNVFHEICLYIIEMTKSLENSENQSRKEDKDTLQNDNNNLMENKKDGLDSKISECISPRDKNTKTSQNISDILQKVYLYRNSEETRIFKAFGNEVEPNSVTEEETSNDILLTPSEEVVKQVTRNTRYFKPLIVNRIQSNPNKKRKKNKKKK